MDKAVREAAQYEAEDKKRKEGIDARNEADSLVFSVEQAITDVGDKLSEDDKTEVEADVKYLKDILEKSNPENMTDGEIDDIKSATEKLTTSSQNLFAKVYEQAQQEQGGQGAGPDGTGGGDQSYTSNDDDDDVVDGDYTEI